MLLFLQPCQSSYCYCQEVLDRLIQCGLLVAEEVGSPPQVPVSWTVPLTQVCSGSVLPLARHMEACLRWACVSCHLGMCSSKVLSKLSASILLGYLAQVALNSLLGFPDLL